MTELCEARALELTESRDSDNAAMNGFHIEGMAHDKGDAVFFAEVSDPVPCEHAFYCNHDIILERLDKSKE